MRAPIIWINGPFGLSKSQVAQVLYERLAGSFVFDPEEMGTALKKLTPKFQGDSQEHPLWIPLMLDALQYAVRDADGPIIVPVTIADVGRHRRMMSGLKDRGMTVHHFTLLSSADLVAARLMRQRSKNPTMLDASQVEQRLTDFRSEQFAKHVEAGERTPDAIADEIAADLGLTLRAPQSDAVRWLKSLGRR